jgi:dihydrofolate reductase
MVEVIIIAAVADNNVIGYEGSIPWHISEDFKHFKQLTLGNCCIFGRKTYESLPIKPLPQRENIVISSNPNYKPQGVIVFNSFETAMDYVKTKGKVYICGGQQIYEQTLPFVNTLELTIVNLEPEGDTYFPEINFNEWILTNEEIHHNYTFKTYKRKN